jgi:hypothetical protein
MMNLRKLILGAAIAALCSGAAMAQSTLGELLDAKAEKLGKDDVQATIVGGTVSGPIPGNMNIEVVYKADGSYTGTYQNPSGGQGGGRAGGFFGKWTLSDDGKFCTEGVGGTGKAVGSCGFFFRLDGQLYIAYGSSDANRALAAYKRSVKR